MSGKVETLVNRSGRNLMYSQVLIIFVQENIQREPTQTHTQQQNIERKENNIFGNLICVILT